MATDKVKEPELIGNTMISKIIGKRPRIPQTYAMRKLRGTPADIKFCENVEKRIADWEKKYEELRLKTLKEREATRLEHENFKVKEVPPIIINAQNILDDFKVLFKKINGKEFNEKNPYSGTNEPLQYICTLIYYFMRHDRFFESPLLRKDLSEPSFDKGTLSIGGYGCGKTSVFNALFAAFRNHIEFVKNKRPSNEKEIISKYDVRSCVSSEVVNDYNSTKIANDVIHPLLSSKPLYIDDILREEDANNFGKLNIFKTVLTHRADRDYKTHLTTNYHEVENNGKVEFLNTQDSLLEFRNRYDGRVHDRLFGTYNIIELKGKSFRR